MKILTNVAACYCVFNDFSFLNISVGSVIHFMKKVYFFVSYATYDGYSEKSQDNKKTFQVLDYLAEKYPDKVVIVRKNWKHQLDQRNDAISIIQADKFPYLLMIDADEIYSNGDIVGLLHYGYKFSDVDVFNTTFHTYFKRLRYRIYPPQLLRALTLIKTSVRLQVTRGVNESKYKTKTIAESHVCWHHLSHIRTNEQMKEKFRVASFEYNLNTEWFDEIWLKWNPGMRNFHPAIPHSFAMVIELGIEDIIDQLKPIFDNEDKYLMEVIL